MGLFAFLLNILSLTILDQRCWLHDTPYTVNHSIFNQFEHLTLCVFKSSVDCNCQCNIPSSRSSQPISFSAGSMDLKWLQWNMRKFILLLVANILLPLSIQAQNHLTLFSVKNSPTLHNRPTSFIPLSMTLSKYIHVLVKGTGHDFCWSGKPIYHLQKQENIHIFQNK